MTAKRNEPYLALIAEEKSEGFTQSIQTRSLDDLPDHKVLIRVSYSSLNYKDALSASGNRGVTRNYPHTPGIDAAGVVVESCSPELKKGDEVIVTGYGLGMDTPGGFGQYIRVPTEWVIALPPGFNLKQSMIIGTAGLTAVMSLDKLERMGLKPEDGEVLVTGATGGVGSMAVMLMASAGYQVCAVTGKTDRENFLMELGASRVIDREIWLENSIRPLLTPKWAAVIDTVGGPYLTQAVQSVMPSGSVACCGMIGSNELYTSIFPFIIRGINLLGISSAEYPITEKIRLWAKLAVLIRPWMLEKLVTELSLKALPDEIQRMLCGKTAGRVIVNLWK
ncbi:MAG: YhdH/YhfP family quinone oxidoreductase [Deltaproteobacteria bacterium]|nr:YhdH/YhfP family quinone oxidoreductase [Deltaproteobacteria bacterium]